jgi:hypothetical protein
MTLRITDQKFTDSGKLTSLALTVTVRSDPQGQRPIAEVVPIPKAGVPTDCKLREYFVNYSALTGNQ